MPDETVTTPMVTINVDGRDIEARDGEMLIAACERAGVYIPRFCYHPRLRSPAMCRMCLVEVEGMRGLQPSCYVPVKDGLVTHTETDGVRKAQEGVLEFLLINHPLDCPVCDRGGECPLQDHTMSFGPGESRFVESKRHFEKPIPISDLVLLDRERCIQCSRCTRVADEVVGDTLIDFGHRGSKLQIITFPDDPFASYFSGNTVQVCPVGALTATPYRFKARPWDVTVAETTCQGCSVGCRGALYETRNEAIRMLGVDTEAVSWGWLCDKGRFGYEYIASPDRLEVPRRRKQTGELVEVTWAEAVDDVAARLQTAGGLVAAIGGARLTNEEAYVLGKFMRVVCGSNDVDSQLDDGLPGRFVAGVTNRARIAGLDSAAAIVLAAPDLKEELPVLYLRVRHAVVDRAVPVHVAGGHQSGLDRFAATKAPRRGEFDVDAFVGSLPDEGDVIVICGRAHAGDDPDALTAWATDLAARLGDRARLLPVLRRANAHGALDMGCAPDLLPGRVAIDDPAAREVLSAVWNGEFPPEAGRSTRQILEAAADGEIELLFLVGADPIADFPDADLARRALERASFVVASDLFDTPSTELADLVLPAAGWGEVDGTVTNIEGRVQRVAAKVVAPGQAASDAGLFRELAERVGVDFGCGTPEATLAEIARVAPAYAGIRPSVFRGVKGKEGVLVEDGEVAFQAPSLDDLAGTAATDGTLVLDSGRTLYDRGTLVAHCPSLAPLAPGAVARLHPADAERLGIADGDGVEVHAGDDTYSRTATVDARVVPGSVWIPHAQDGPVATPIGATAKVERIG